MKTRKFAVTLEMQLEAGTPEEAASLFVERVRSERHAVEVDVLEDRGEDQWTRIGRRVVRLDEVGTK
ncbi:MAG TPA: hypothetical protein VFA01_01350 [Candidatus Dormibacteraeota bacterium]|nr:hypothetical protein [Candidatus Dormibacteraeota bacterium]